MLTYSWSGAPSKHILIDTRVVVRERGVAGYKDIAVT